jgi:cytochrome c-type biogenesis protein CcmH
VRRQLATLLVTALIGLVGAPAAVAACPQTNLPDLEDEVMCTVCGTTLGLATEAPQAQRERAFILERIERCESKDQIKAALAAEFGAEVLATPEEEGFGLAAYIVPVLVLLGGGAAVAFTALRSRRRRGVGAARATGASADAGAGSPDIGASSAARLDADLERYDP